MDKRHFSISETSAPASEPVSVAEARSFLNLDTSADDALLAIFIPAARQYFESVTGRATASRNFLAAYNGFPSRRGAFVLPRAPLGVVASVKYLDLDGVETTLASTEYRVDAASLFGRVSLAYGKEWPDAADMEGSVYIAYSAGYATPAAVPAVDRTILLMLVADMYEHRNSQSELKLTPDSKFDRVLAARAISEVF